MDSPHMPTPDYSAITSAAQAERLVSEGKLAKFYLYPERFGGTEEENDSRYLPIWAAKEKHKFDAMVSERYDDGRITGYMCKPSDHGESLVPTSVQLIAFRAGSPMFVSTIEIWQP